MATHRRNLAAAASMDPTLKRQHQPVSSTTHPHPDPATATIRSISRRFSNLYSNHKRLSAHHRHLDSACPALTKSKSEHGTTLQKSHKDPDFTIKKSGGDEIKKASEEEVKKRPSVSVSLEMGEGRRRSFSSSQTELADFFSCNTVKVISVDMPPFMQIHAVGCARKVYDSLEKFTSKSLAFSLKKEFDGVYGPAWHCIVGKSFGSFVTHSVGGFIYFSMDPKLYVLLFKTTVQRAD